MTYGDLKKRRRADYRYFIDFQTRWSDNDMYDHMNNSIYNILIDSIVNSYLIKECGLHPPTSPQYGLVVQTRINFFGPIAFPTTAQVALRVNRLGKSSVVYEAAIYEKGSDEVKSVGEIIHVFVDRTSGRPATNGIMPSYRESLQKILIEQPKL